MLYSYKHISETRKLFLRKERRQQPSSATLFHGQCTKAVVKVQFSSPVSDKMHMQFIAMRKSINGK